MLLYKFVVSLVFIIILTSIPNLSGWTIGGLFLIMLSAYIVGLVDGAQLPEVDPDDDAR